QGRHHGADRQDDVAWRERKHQRFHGTPRAVCAVLSLLLRQNGSAYAIAHTGHGYDKYRSEGYCYLGRGINPLSCERPRSRCSAANAELVQWLCGRSSQGMRLWPRPFFTSQSSVLFTARSMWSADREKS